jgi:hypothetical protein
LRRDASPPQERVDVDRATDAAVSALDREAFTGVLERLRRMSIEEAAAGYAALSGGPVGRPVVPPSGR